jgi:FKBP-type peptidyl-prolyl cis-trans isomerase 2
MKKLLILIVVLPLLLFSGCVGQQKAVVVKVGDNVSVDYIGSTSDGKVFDTSIENVARQNNIYNPQETYQPLNFTVGKGQIIKGFDDGVVGMKVGDKKTLTISPELGYGPIDPKKIQVFPIVESIPTTSTTSKFLEVPSGQFNSLFGPNHKVGDNVNIPNTNINLTVKSLGTNVSLVYNLPVGYEVIQNGAPWNETVTSVDDKNITLKIDAKKNDVVNIQHAPWNTTIIDVNNTNITLRHNPIPDKEITGTFGTVRIHFNETSIIIDQNNKLAGKTLIFDVTLKSIS